MSDKLTIFDPAEGLTSDEAIAAFVVVALASGDADYIVHARRVATRAEDDLRQQGRTGHDENP